MKKYLAFILAICMILVIVGCNNNSDNNDNGENAQSNASVTDGDESKKEITRANTPDSLPDGLDFDGISINIYYFGNSGTKNYDAVGEQGGDIVFDKVYNRNRSTEERLNVKLNWIEGSDDWDTFPTQVRTALLAGVTDYDLIMLENSRAFQHSLQGLYVDLMNAPYIDIDQPWWYTNLMKEGSIDQSRRFSVSGDLTMTTLMGASAMLFNKKIFTDYFADINEIYNHVLNGTWTHDVLAEYSRGVYTDLNGNGTVDAGDLFGFEFNQWHVPNYLSMSTGLSYIQRDENGLPVLDVYTENGILWGETLYNLFYTDNISIRRASRDDIDLSFRNGLNLFYVGTLEAASDFRNVSFEFGILPHPKLSVNLDYMSGAATANGNAVAIPVSAPREKFDATCAVVESLSAEAYRHVVPAWYDISLKIKYAEAEIDAQMVDIIYDHITSPFIMIADKELSTGSIFAIAVFGSKNKGAFTSYYEKNEGSLQKKWDKMIDSYLSIIEN